MNNSWQHYAEQKMLETFNAGGSIADQLQSFADDWDSTGRPGELFTSATSACLSILSCALGEGHTFVSSNGIHLNDGAPAVALRLNRALRAKEWPVVNASLGALASALESYRAVLPHGNRLAFAVPKIEPQRISITLKQDAPAAPQEVRVIAMPTRETESTLERDADLNIVGSKQVERDAA